MDGKDGQNPKCGTTKKSNSANQRAGQPQLNMVILVALFARILGQTPFPGNHGMPRRGFWKGPAQPSPAQDSGPASTRDGGFILLTRSLFTRVGAARGTGARVGRHTLCPTGASLIGLETATVGKVARLVYTTSYHGGPSTSPLIWDSNGEQMANWLAD